MYKQALGFYLILYQMVTMSALQRKWSWQEALSDLITDPKELLALLELDTALLPAAELAAQSFPLKVPRGYLARMQKGNPDDPLLQQILPLGLELSTLWAGYDTDPLQESRANPIPGLLHKYHGRVLITLTSACAIHCRYCFRRHFPYKENNPGKSGWEKIFAYIKHDTSISEVILSGGDPLAVSDALLKNFSDELSLISHVNILRLHTRFPVVLPERITAELLQWLTQLKLTPVIVLHVNHPNEINAPVRDALLILRQAGIQVLNQAVLLKGINDSAETLIALSQTLFSAGVLPYYLHRLDKVQGAAHFDVDLARAQELHAAIRNKLPGYLVPRLAWEEPGGQSKIF